MERKIDLLDCTLRDGAHLNGGQFGKSTIKEIITNLVHANVDIIEVGFFDNNEHDEDSSFFSSIEDVKRILPQNCGNSKFALMADFVDVSNIEPYDGTIDFFRLSFKRHRWDWAINAAKILMQKGYKCYINPVNCNVYTDEQYLEGIRRVNELHPYGFSIVDTFGVMRKADLSAKYFLAENNLDTDIVIGVHLHENLGLAYSLAQHFLEIANPKRNISIDGSLLGMGRTPGNLCIEQIMDHLNYQYAKNYHTEPAYDAIDDCVAPIKRKLPWGYSIPYALSGKYGLHRTYAEYLIEKNRLKTKDIQRILSMIDKEHVEMFDETYVEDLYRKYLSVEYDDSSSVTAFRKLLTNKKIVVLCPGSSINTEQNKIRQYIQNNNPIVISVNFIPEFVETDFVFCANMKRIHNLQNADHITKIITSNIEKGSVGENVLMFSYNNLAYFNDIFCEDSTLMLLRVLNKCGCTEVAIAGFDGFVSGAKNYYIENYTNEEGKNVSADTVKEILASTFATFNILYLTPSVYE